MNSEQIKSALRWLIATFGAGVAAFIAGRGWASAESVMSLLTSETFLGIMGAGGALAWGILTHTQKNAVAIVNTIAEDPTSPVKGVVVDNSLAGHEMARGSETVVVAGTQPAREISQVRP